MIHPLINEAMLAFLNDPIVNLSAIGRQAKISRTGIGNIANGKALAQAATAIKIWDIMQGRGAYGQFSLVGVFATADRYNFDHLHRLVYLRPGPDDKCFFWHYGVEEYQVRQYTPGAFIWVGKANHSSSQQLYRQMDMYQVNN